MFSALRLSNSAWIDDRRGLLLRLEHDSGGVGDVGSQIAGPSPLTNCRSRGVILESCARFDGGGVAGWSSISARCLFFDGDSIVFVPQARAKSDEDALEQGPRILPYSGLCGGILKS